jgi:hypothetical protein
MPYSSWILEAINIDEYRMTMEKLIVPEYLLNQLSLKF